MTHSRKMTFGRYDYATFLGFFAYASSSMAIPIVLVQLARELGFSLEQGGMSAGGALQISRTMSIFFSMLICGFVAGRFGKRRSFGWSIIIMGIGIIICAIAPAYVILFFALFIAGIGEGGIEGLSSPFVQDLHPVEPGRYINFSHAFWSVGVLVTVLSAGILLSLEVSWRLIIAMIGIISLIPALLLLLPERRGHEYPEHPEPLSLKTIYNKSVTIIKIPRFWLFFACMFLAGGGEFCLTFWCASYIQLNFIPEAWAGGAATASFAAGMVLGRTGWGYLVRQKNLWELIIFSAIAGTLISFFFPALSNFWIFLGLLFLAGIATAPFWPSLLSYGADCLPKTDTTMLFILLSCSGIPGCGFFVWLMGYIGTLSGGLSLAFYLVPGCFLLLAALIYFDRLVHRNTYFKN